MGKAKITGNLTEGRYRVQRTYNDDGAIAQRNALQERAADLSARIPQLESALFSATLDFQAAQQAAAIVQSDYAAAASGAPGAPPLAEALSAVQKAQERIIRAAADRDRIRAERASVLASYEAVRRGLLQIQSALAAPEQEVWCADYTEDAEGEVASIEVPGEPQKLLLRPQFEGRGEHDGERDGMLQPRGILTPEQSYFNVAVLPGWQKWKPTYRIGTITEVEGDVCNVDLDPAESSEVGTGNRLGINRFDQLEGVPIEYMDCNGDVFEPNDRVVIEFEGKSWDAPKVIGFESNPRPCVSIVCAVRGLDLIQRVVAFNSDFTRVVKTYPVAVGSGATQQGYWPSNPRPSGPFRGFGVSSGVVCHGITPDDPPNSGYVVIDGVVRMLPSDIQFKEVTGGKGEFVARYLETGNLPPSKIAVYDENGNLTQITDLPHFGNNNEVDGQIWTNIRADDSLVVMQGQVNGGDRAGIAGMSRDNPSAVLWSYFDAAEGALTDAIDIFLDEDYVVNVRRSTTQIPNALTFLTRSGVVVSKKIPPGIPNTDFIGAVYISPAPDNRMYVVHYATGGGFPSHPAGHECKVSIYAFDRGTTGLTLIKTENLWERFGYTACFRMARDKGRD